MTPEQARAAVQSLVDYAVTQLPRHYDGKKNWEETKRIWAGVKFRRDGLRVSTKRRWREVRHGLQSHYRVQFPGDPKSPSPLYANVRSVEWFAGDEQTIPAWIIETGLASPLDFSARVERWNRGVRFYSVEITGHMNIRLDLQGRFASFLDYSEIPPALVIDPSVTDAAFHLDALHVDRISKIGGEVAEQWGELVEKIIREILIDDINNKLRVKMNKAIDKKRDDLRFSAMDWFHGLTKTDSAEASPENP